MAGDFDGWDNCLIPDHSVFTSDSEYAAHVREAHFRCGEETEFLGRHLICYLKPKHKDVHIYTRSGMDTVESSPERYYLPVKMANRIDAKQSKGWKKRMDKAAKALLDVRDILTTEENQQLNEDLARIAATRRRAAGEAANWPMA